MLINSDWHVHSEHSYDATNPLLHIVNSAKELGLRNIGITDHLNFNDGKFVSDVINSSKSVNKIKKDYPNVILGVELTPIELPEFEYIAKTKTREGYIPPIQAAPYEIELAMTKNELMELGIQYAIGAAHWRVDVPNGRELKPELNECIKEWYRQQMWLACDERVTVLGHPWWNGDGLWYNDFSLIPRSMNRDIAAALLENKKYAECNSSFFKKEYSTEKFRYQYAEFLRELFEAGIPITYGSDSHHNYTDVRPEVEKYLTAVGFTEGDFSEISKSALWQ